MIYNIQEGNLLNMEGVGRVKILGTNSISGQLLVNFNGIAAWHDKKMFSGIPITEIPYKWFNADPDNYKKQFVGINIHNDEDNPVDLVFRKTDYGLAFDFEVHGHSFTHELDFIHEVQNLFSIFTGKQLIDE